MGLVRFILKTRVSTLANKKCTDIVKTMAESCSEERTNISTATVQTLEKEHCRNGNSVNTDRQKTRIYVAKRD